MLERIRTLGVTGIPEKDYRQFYLQTDIKQTKLVMLLFTIPLVGLVINDYSFLGTSTIFYAAIALRIALIAIITLEFILIGKAKTYKAYDNIITAGALAIIIGSGILNVTRPENFIAHTIFTGGAVFMLYIAIPNRFLTQTFLATFTTAGELVIVAIGLYPFNTTAFTSVFFSLLAANLIALGSSWQLHSYRKKSYKDLTERKQLQQKLEDYNKSLEQIVVERTEKLKTAERLAAIGATAGMVGHDIRNPLTAITGAVYIAEKKAKTLPPNPNKEELTKSLDIIKDQILYINKIIMDLQDYARQLTPAKEETDIPQIIQAVLSTIKIPEDITMETHFDKQLRTAMMDQTFLRRILTNLANNAVQAMPNGGKLTLTAEAEENHIIITVQDTGAGIPEEAKQKLFTPMFTTKSKGQGFGLAVVKRMTEALDGTVTFESEMGKSTKFTVRIPNEKK
jgi:signal transduction histidine kinase